MLTQARISDFTTATLDNGLEVAIAPDTTAPAVALNITVDVGSYDEVAGRTGFAHLFEHLMFQGSANVTSGEHMATIEALGGSINAWTSADVTTYFETFQPGAFELALWLEADRFTSLQISPANFEAQRQVVKEEKRQRYDNQPYGQALQSLVAQHYSTCHPYGHLPIGSMADLDAACLDEVREFFSTWYQPQNLKMVIAGNIDPDVALEQVQRYFGPLPNRERPSRNQPSPRPTSGNECSVTQAVPHTITWMSYLTPSPGRIGYLPTVFLISVLTDGSSSRLHRRLVRDEELAEEVHSTALELRRDSCISAIVTRPSNISSAIKIREAIKEEIANIAASGITDEELQRVIALHERDVLTALSSVESRAGLIQESWLTHGHSHAFFSEIERLHHVSIDDIAQAAAQLVESKPSLLHYVKED